MVYVALALLAVVFILARWIVLRDRNIDGAPEDDPDDDCDDDEDDDDFGPKILGEGSIDIIRDAAHRLSAVFDEIGAALKPGMTTAAIEQTAIELLKKDGLGAAMLNYRGFPASAAVSLNEEVLHAIPSTERTIQGGDLVKVQVNGELHGFFGAMGWTFPIGAVDDEKARLLRAGRQALTKAIEAVRAGVRTGDIGATIQETIEDAGFSVVRDFIGYGIGRGLHQEPKISGVGIRGRGLRFMSGQVLCLHVIASAGSWEVDILEDDWTAVTQDKRPSVLFTAMVLVTKDGCETLTRSPGDALP